MVTWHLTVKLFTVKRHERATLRKLWNQTGNSSLLLPAKCWPPLHLIAALESIGLCSKNRVWCFRASPVKTGYYAQIYARLEVLCSNYAGLKWHRFPLLATLYIPVRVAGKICIHLNVHLSQFSETTALCCKNISIMPALCLMLQIPYKSQYYAGNIRQTPGVCSLWWPHVVAGISARFSKFTFVLFCYITNHNLNIEIQSGNRVNCSPRDYNFSWTQYCLPLNTSDGITYEQTSYMSRSVARLSANEKAKQMHLMINQCILRFRFTFYKTRQKAASKLTWVSRLS